MNWGAIIGLGLVWVGLQPTRAIFAEEPSPGAGGGMAAEVGRLFEARCLACHREGKEKGSYRMDTFEGVASPGRSGKTPVAPGKPEESELYLRLTQTDEDERMPFDEPPLSAEEVSLVRRWIAGGAALDPGLTPATRLASLKGDAPLAVPPADYPHPPPVTALALSPRGDQFAVGGRGEILVCPVEGGAARRVGGMHARVRAMAWHPDGGTIVVAAGIPGRAGGLFVVDVAKGEVIRRLGAAPDEILTVAFDPTGALLASGGADNLIHVHDWATGELKRRIAQHADWVMSVRFSPDGKHLASASRDRTARVYSVETWEMETTYNEHGGMVFAVAFNEDGTEVWSGGRDRRVHVWKALEGKRVKDFGVGAGEIQAMESAGDKVWVASSDGVVREYSGKSRSQTATFPGRMDWVFSVARSGGSEALLAGGPAGEVLIWGGGDAPTRLAPFERLNAAAAPPP